MQTKAPVKKPASKAKPASKPAPKAKAVPKKKVLVDIDENGDDSMMNVDPSDGDHASFAGPSEPEPPKNAKKKTASETYTKVRSIYTSFVIGFDHILSAVTNRAHSQEARFIHWERRDYHTNHVGL